MNASITTGRVHPAALLLELGHRARQAATVQELEFLLVNDSRLLLPYRQAVWWTHQWGVQALSGVVQPDRNVPYAQWVAQVCRHLVQQHSAACVLTATDLPPDLASQWAQWWPAHAVWLPMHLKSGAGAGEAAGMLLAGPEPIQSDRLQLLVEWGSMWIHAWQALQHQHLGSPRLWWAHLRHQQARQTWWRRPVVWATAALLVLAAWPVHLTVLAPGELVAAQPVVLRAPMDGVVEQIHVQPNEMVQEGQLLFSLDEAQIASRLEISRQALQTAETEYRQFAQLALGDMRSKSQLAALAGKIGERRTEQAFLTEQRQRTQVLAPRAGMALFDAPTEWIGKPVQAGERVMRIAQPDVVEVEAWLPIGDAIPLQVGAPVQLYLAADPLHAVQAQLRYMAYEAVARPDGSYAYRVRAGLMQPGAQRIGLKGTAKLQGEKVSLAYWMVRKPWASIRQWVTL